MVKPKVAFFGMTSCKGCYFQMLLANEKLPPILESPNRPVAGEIDAKEFFPELGI